jgi:hypothetical protein
VPACGTWSWSSCPGTAPGLHRTILHRPCCIITIKSAFITKAATLCTPHGDPSTRPSTLCQALVAERNHMVPAYGAGRARSTWKWTVVPHGAPCGTLGGPHTPHRVNTMMELFH